MKRVLAVIIAAAVAAGATPRAASARPAEGTVTSLTVAPVSGKAEVVVGVSGAVKVSEFTLTGPDRVVIDIDNATLGLAPTGYDKVARGGITDVRYSQFRKNTVRVVIYLAADRPYKVWRTVGQVHIGITSEPAAQFATWKLGSESAPRTALASGPDRLADKLTAPKPATTAEKPATTAEKPATTVEKPATPPPTTARTEPAPAKPAPAKPAPAVAPPARLAENPAPAGVEPLDDTRPMRTVVQQSVQPQQRSPQPRISVTYQGSDIRDVLAAFAAFSGRTIIPSSAVPPAKVDAEIRDQPWDVALQAILAAQGLAATEDANGIIIVDTQDRIAARAQTEPLVTRVVRLNYQRSTAVAEQLRQRLLQCIPSERSNGSSSSGAGQSPSAGGSPAQAPGGSGASGGAGGCVGRGNVSPDEVTNAVSITAPSSMIDDLVAFAETLDMRQPQVNIKAKIILVNRTDLEALGLKYDLSTASQFFSQVLQGRPLPTGGFSTNTTPPTVLLGGNTVSAIANASGSVPGAALRVIYSTALGNFDFSTFLDALQEVSLLDVQAEPSVTILNNRTAELISGSQVPFVPTAGGAGGGLIGVVNVERVQTGVTLRVTPSVTNNRHIMMRVETINSGATFGTNGVLIDNNSSKSELLVPDGQTVVIGGLTQTTVNLSKSGIPLLVDLPLIGRLFGVTSRTETRRDLLILITPHIIDEGPQSPEAARR